MTIQLEQAAAGQIIRPADSVHILVGTDLDMFYETFRLRGVKIVHAPLARPWGMRDFAIRDCDGHILTFATHL